jgi:DNA (cytosine-5)-methyltransferase 1
MSSKKLNVLSLFGGIECGRVALDRVGIAVDKYYSSEICKNAMKVADGNYNDIIQLGDVTKWKEWNIDYNSIDLLFAGFPCQSWSLAGKQKGISDERGQLVYCMMDILNEIRKTNSNVKFLFENVKMKPEYLDFLNDHIGVYPIRFNSEDVSAGMRDRYYWTNIDGVTPLPIKNIKLSDILDSGKVDRDKALCITKRYEGFSGSQAYLRRRYFGKSMGQAVFENCEPSEQKEMWKADDRKEYDTVGTIRSLSTRECEKIQTLPVGYVENILGDNMKAKGVIGNGWTVDVIAHILSFMK